MRGVDSPTCDVRVSKTKGSAGLPSRPRQEESELAEVIQIEGAGSTAKTRNPLGVVGLAFITLGIYSFFWYYFVNREMRDFGSARNTPDCGTSPATSVVAITLGAFVIVPPFVSIYKAFKRMNATSELAGSGEGFDAGLGLLIWVFISPIAMYIFQMKLNEAWRAQAAPGGSTSD